jgi:hypothetical protein
MNYYHGCWQSGTDGDLLNADQVTAYGAYAADWVTGFTDGTGARSRCGPRGAGSSGYSVRPFIGHRDFPQ